MKVYVVSRGSYSDRDSVAVFTTSELAEEYIAVNRSDHDVSEFELDCENHIVKAGLKRYFVRLDYLTGEVSECRCVGWSTYDVDFEHKVKAYVKDGFKWVYLSSVAARDPEHAVKIASEKRVQYRAEHQD